jgi:hypothetical protein
MTSIVTPRARRILTAASIGFGILVLSGLGALAPAAIDAACGAIPDGGRLARYAGRHADTIVLARLIEQDSDRNYHVEILEVYRGEAASPIIDGWPESDGIIDVGSCTHQGVKPGERFIYASGDRERFGLMQLVFPEAPRRGFVISHWGGEYRSLDGILALLGVLPETSTTDPEEATITQHQLGFVATIAAALLGFACALFRPVGKRPATPQAESSTRDIHRR